MNLTQFCHDLERALTELNDRQEKVALVESMLSSFTCREQDCCKNWDCASDRYARHLIFRGEQSGCCVVAMSWAPGQGTPLHDHDGTWCVEGCLQGRLQIVQYELDGTLEEDGEPLFSFQRRGTEQVGRGAVGCLIPPFEHHTIHNPYSERAVTLHVYGKELTKSTCFYLVREDIYRREERSLSYTSS